MKYLEDDGLSRLTARLRRDGRGRVISGRLEAYTMKRAGRDKKYAAHLGHAHVEFKESLENNAWKKEKGEKHSNGKDSDAADTSSRKRSRSVGEERSHERPAKKARSRAISFDEYYWNKKGTDSAAASEVPRPPPQDLGSRRRLLTDLILTLNMSFPDYDFGCVKPSDFELVSLQNVMNHVHAQLAQVLLEDPNLLSELWGSMDNVMKLAECEIYKWNAGDFRSSQDEEEEEEEEVYNDTGVGVVNKQHEDDVVVDLVVTENGTGNDDPTTPTTTDADLRTRTIVAASAPPPEMMATCLWSFHYLIVNTNLKRILFFSCSERMRLPGQHHNDDDDDEHVVTMLREGETDFDLDPAAVAAGGLPVSTV